MYVIEVWTHFVQKCKGNATPSLRETLFGHTNFFDTSTMSFKGSKGYDQSVKPENPKKTESNSDKEEESKEEREEEREEEPVKKKPKKKAKV